jgi:replicative DNA helicase
MKSVNQSLELEQRVLEYLMGIGEHTNIRAQKAFLKLTSDCFYNLYHDELFALVKNEFTKQQGFNFVDILVLIPKSNDELFNSLQWIINNNRQFYINNKSLEADIDKLILLNTLRKQMVIAQQTIVDVTAQPNAIEAQTILNQGITEISNLNYQQSKDGVYNVEIAEAYLDGDLSEDMKIPTTCDSLNIALDGGIMPKSLIIIAAGASVGKTGFSIFLMDCIARAQPNTECLFFSIEMESKHIWTRHVGIRAGKKFDKLNFNEKNQAITSSLEVPVKIYDAVMCRSVSDIDFIITTSRLRAMEKPLSVIVVDYLGLVQNKGTFERNDLKQSDITSKLAQLAIELNCTVIALTQINRGAANRANDDRCPWPHDAADSSGGHRSSALWIGVDRPELYLEDQSFKNQFVIKCRKNRFGDNFELIFAFNEGTFAETSPGYFRKPYSTSKNPEKALFSPQCDDFVRS